MCIFMGELSAFEYHEKELCDLLGKFVHAWGQVKTISYLCYDPGCLCATWLRRLISELDIKDVFPNLRRVIFGDVEYFKADESFLRVQTDDDKAGDKEGRD